MAMWIKLGIKIVGAIVVLIFLQGKVQRIYEFWDSDKDRGAVAVDKDVLGESFSTPVYLDQGWDESQSLWFYNITQGSDLVPYDFFMVLEQENSERLFRDNENLNAYRFLPQKTTFSNPDSLPVGLVMDTYQGKEYMGFTCAACHTNQIDYKGKAIRIDGGPAMADVGAFLIGLQKALITTQDNAEKKARFVKGVLDRNGFFKILTGGRNYTSEEDVLAELKIYCNRMLSYNTINHSGSTKYGYARLDAFGRIFNQVLEHVLTKEDLDKVLPEVLPNDQAENLLDELQDNLIRDGDFDHLLNKLEQLLSAKEIRQRTIIDLRNKLFIKANAPVSFPFLWDISQHDYVQWNGIVSNGGLGPLGRNTGEVIGVFATLDWQKKPGFSLYAWLGGQGFSSHISYQSSVNVRNLRHIEEQLKELESPQWPAMFPALDTARVARGKKLFEKQCTTCHQDIDRSAKDRRVIAQMTKFKVLGTDQTMAQNSVSYEGYSGIVRGMNLDVGVGSMYIQERAPVAALLNSVTASVVATPDPDKWAIRRFPEWVYDLVAAYFENEVKTTIKRGNYDPDTTKNPFASLRAYKGRPLNGIWATAPYLHNGSVPTLYDLLLLKKRSTDPDDGEYRPDTFWVGHREFDPNKVGFVTDKKEGSFKFETHRKANSNAGHEYGARKFTEQDRWDLVEYMKSL